MVLTLRVYRLLLAMLIVVAASSSSFAAETHTGKIVSVGDGKIVISDTDDTNEVFVVPDDATITRNGKEANLSDLGAGDAVTVTASRKKGMLIAKTIDATTGK